MMLDSLALCCSILVSYPPNSPELVAPPQRASGDQGAVASDVPLCVDVDRALFRTRLPAEAVLSYVRHHPIRALVLPLRRLAGCLAFEDWIAAHSELDIAVLPVRDGLAAWLEREAQAGRAIVLVTSTPKSYVAAIAHRFAFASRVLNVRGPSERSGSPQSPPLADVFGERAFDYVGSCESALRTTAGARRVYMLEPCAGNPARPRRLPAESPREPLQLPRGAQGDEPPKRLSSWARALRFHQWLKNLLVAVPILAAHRLQDPVALYGAATAFVAFGLVASGVYVVNDLLDLDADRHHRTKRTRPFAAGHLSIAHGMLAAALLLVVGFVLAARLLPASFSVVLGLYFLGTCAYSLWLKQWAVIDVAALAALYVTRVVAGAEATSVLLSFWLVAFSLHLFFSLALAKRYTELVDLPVPGPQAVPRRGYRRSDLPLLMTLGVASGLISALVLALYINSPDSQLLYGRPKILWLLIPILMVWISRVWLLAHRETLHEDPVVYAFTDAGSLALAAAAAAALVLAL